MYISSINCTVSKMTFRGLAEPPRSSVPSPCTVYVYGGIVHVHTSYMTESFTYCRVH